MEPLIRTEALVKTYHGRDVVAGVNLSVGAGEILGVAGLMGSGRTELLRALFGADNYPHDRPLNGTFLDTYCGGMLEAADHVAAFLAGVPVIVHTVHGWSFNDTQPAWQRRLYVGLERAAAKITSLP